ncbi:MAG: hypothetical protein LBL52_03745 [Rickettsiales bacterium]|jgi:hypothetical protein|nr:hypothetical protein [Rickettsiales bacterium]
MDAGTSFARLDLSFPKSLGLSPDSRIFLYFPNHQEIGLDRGKLYGEGLYVLPVKEVKATEIRYPDTIAAFQFLVMIKNSAGAEIVSDAHFVGDRMHQGPFISADYTLKGRRMEITLRSFQPPKDTMFELEGVPDGARIDKAAHSGDGSWTLPTDAKSAVIELASDTPREISIGVIARSKSQPRYPSSFNIIANVGVRTKGYRKQYKEMKIDIGSMTKKMLPKAKNYMISVHGDTDSFCIEGFRKIGNKWVASDGTKSMVIRSFDKESPYIELIFSFLAEAGGKLSIETRRTRADFSGIVARFKDYAQCAACINRSKCTMFKDFMDYVGNTTMLRQIISR